MLVVLFTVWIWIPLEVDEVNAWHTQYILAGVVVLLYVFLISLGLPRLCAYVCLEDPAVQKVRKEAESGTIVTDEELIESF